MSEEADFDLRERSPEEVERLHRLARSFSEHALVLQNPSCRFPSANDSIETDLAALCTRAICAVAKGFPVDVMTLRYVCRADTLAWTFNYWQWKRKGYTCDGRVGTAGHMTRCTAWNRVLEALRAANAIVQDVPRCHHSLAPAVSIGVHAVVEYGITEFEEAIAFYRTRPHLAISPHWRAQAFQECYDDRGTETTGKPSGADPGAIPAADLCRGVSRRRPGGSGARARTRLPATG